MTRNKKILMFAIGFSLFSHGAFLVSSNFMVLEGLRGMLSETRKLFRMQDVQDEVVPVELFEKETEAAVRMTAEGAKPEIDEIIFEQEIYEDTAIDEKKEKLKEDRIDEEVFKERAEREDVLDFEAERIKKEAEPEKRFLEKSLTAGEISAISKRATGAVAEMEKGAAREGFKWASMGEEKKPGEKEFFQPRGDEFAPGGQKIQRGEYEEIDAFMGIKVHKYVDPSTKEGFFRIDIGVRNGKVFKVMPKEVIFLVDSSKSITAEKLAYVKEALADSLKIFLNPRDKFNIVAFREGLVKFSENSLENTPENIKKAGTFVDGLESVGQTDVERALMGIVDLPMENVPSYVVLVSDGRPTTGVMDSREIIQEITRRNRMKRPVFAFGGGERVNRYLMEFVAYQNRGWSHFADRNFHIKKEFMALCGDIKDPILLNVRYRLVGVNADEIYPRHLPDFYEGREMSIYGTFRDEDEFSMQLLGELEGQKKELIFKKSLAKAAEGGPELAREWAFRKIYYLISLDSMGLGDREAMRGEIADLSKKYEIVTPYSIDAKE